MSDRLGRSKGVALVTGGSRGIGYELARMFAGTGFDVVLVARNEEELEENAEYFRERFGVEAHVLPADLSEPGAAEAIYEECNERGIDVTVLVNNAGFGTHGPFVEEDRERMLDEIQVNVTALTELTRLFLPEFVEREAGGVLNVASSAAFAPGPKMGVYYATKSYVLSFSRAISEEVRPQGISVTALCPGPVDTDFKDAADNEGMRLYRFEKDPRTVARAGYRGLLQGDRVVVPGFGMKLAYYAAKVAPRSVDRTVTKILNS